MLTATTFINSTEASMENEKYLIHAKGREGKLDEGEEESFNGVGCCSPLPCATLPHFLPYDGHYPLRASILKFERARYQG